MGENVKCDKVDATRYLCSECGFMEEWIDNKEDMNKIAESYKQ